MKTVVLYFATLVACGALVGCDRETGGGADAGSTTAASNGPSALETATEAVNQTVESAKIAGSNAVQQIKNTSTQTLNTVSQKAEELSAQGSAKAQELIDSAQNYFAAGKYKEALAELKEASNEALSPEQEEWVASLTAKIEETLKSLNTATTNATRSATEAFNKMLQ